MLFNSISFAVFLPVVFLLYWFATGGKYKVQNILLLVASYYFYGSWDSWAFSNTIISLHHHLPICSEYSAFMLIL